MSFNFFQDIEDLLLIDSHFGVIPTVCSICKEMGNDNIDATTVRNLIRHCRQLMILQEASFEHSNKDKMNVTIKNMTCPEKLFFESMVPSNYLGDSFTEEKILCKLKSQNYIRKFSKTADRGSYYVKKSGKDKDYQTKIIRKLFSYISSYIGDTRNLTIDGAYPDDKIKEKISYRMTLTAKLIDKLLKQNLTFTVLKEEPSLEVQSSQYENKVNFPLVCTLKIGKETDESQYVLYLLSFFEYHNRQQKKKKVSNMHSEMMNYFDSIFSNNVTLNCLLNDIRQASGVDVDSNCYMKTMVMQPKDTAEEEYDENKVCVINIFGFVKDLVMAKEYNHLHMNELREYIDNTRWERWFPVRGSFVRFQLLNKEECKKIKEDKND